MTNHQSTPLSDGELRLQLHGLSKERELERDLWPGIHAQMQHAAKPSNSHWRSFLVAASVLLFVVIVLPLATSNSSGVNDSIKVKIVSAEVKAMDVEYRAALKEFTSMPVNPAMQAQLQLLDDSVNQLHQALNQSPKSTYLIPMLRRTYFQRLQLTQRAMAFNFT